MNDAELKRIESIMREQRAELEKASDIPWTLFALSMVVNEVRRLQAHLDDVHNSEGWGTYDECHVCAFHKEEDGDAAGD